VNQQPNQKDEPDRKQERRQQPDVPTTPIAPAWLIGRTGTVAPLFGQNISIQVEHSLNCCRQPGFPRFDGQ